MSKSMFITGERSEIGKATAKSFAQRDWQIQTTMHPPEKFHDFDEFDNVTTYQLHVTDYPQIQYVVNEIIPDHGPVNIIINAASYGLLGLTDVTREWLLVMRERRQETIINLSSLVALVPFAVLSMDTVTKFAVETFTELVSEEVKTFGICMKAVEPGPTKINFDGCSMQEGILTIYKTSYTSGKQEEVAELIYDGKDQLHYASPEIKTMGMEC